MYDPNHNASPVNAIPLIAVALAAPIVLIELALQLGERGLIGGPEAVGWRIELIRNFGFFDTIFDRMLETHRVQPDWLWRFVTYPFLAVSVAEALIGAVIVLGTGTYFAKYYPAHRVVAAFVIPAATAALVVGLVTSSRTPMIGPMPAAFGMLGTYAFIQWVKDRMAGNSGWKAFGLVGVLIAMQGIRGLFFGDWAGSLANATSVITGFLASFYVTISGRQMARRFFRKLRRG